MAMPSPTTSSSTPPQPPPQRIIGLHAPPMFENSPVAVALEIEGQHGIEEFASGSPSAGTLAVDVVTPLPSGPGFRVRQKRKNYCNKKSNACSGLSSSEIDVSNGTISISAKICYWCCTPKFTRQHGNLHTEKTEDTIVVLFIKLDVLDREYLIVIVQHIFSYF
ncbi:hypothetical protein ACP70R_029054 [Stipagrostis hirtigluma subsp. patula]